VSSIKSSKMTVDRSLCGLLDLGGWEDGPGVLGGCCGGEETLGGAVFGWVLATGLMWDWSPMYLGLFVIGKAQGSSEGVRDGGG
jgi:hypothetical protein